MKYKIKGKIYFYVSYLLIFFWSIFLYVHYIHETSNNLLKYSDAYYDKYLFQKLNKYILNIIPKNIDDDILIIFQNNDGDILYVDYNLEKVYKILNEVSLSLDNNEYKNISINIPFLGMSENVFYNNIGPNIKVGINMIDASLIKVNTKITDYGLNNALLEVYVNIKITSQILLPGKSKKNNYEYNFLIASKVINGKVPSLYGNNILSSSRIINVPIKI